MDLSDDGESHERRDEMILEAKGKAIAHATAESASNSPVVQMMTWTEFLHSTVPNTLFIETILDAPYETYYAQGGKFTASLLVVRRNTLNTTATNIQTELYKSCKSSKKQPARDLKAEDQKCLIMQQIDNKEILDILSHLPIDTELRNFHRRQDLMRLLMKEETAAERSERLAEHPLKRRKGHLVKKPVISLEEGCGTIQGDRRDFQFKKDQHFVAFLVRFQGPSGSGTFSLRMTPQGASNSFSSVGFTSLSKYSPSIAEGRNAGILTNAKRLDVIEKLRELRDLMNMENDSRCQELLQEIIDDLDAVN